ncbi:MAG: YigZ family protein [Victivallales bacterium]|nr:YigZ family protein [Victivallales bacterium]
MRALISAAPFLLVVKNSRFYAELLGAESSEAARTLLGTQRTKYPDASHVIHAMVVGPTGGVLGCSDDGEPAGTAGRPVLEVLKGSGITNVLLTVTRWFGGTKLGTGGLVKAYGDAAKGVLATAVSREIIPMTHFAFTLPYPLIESGKRLLREFGFVIQAEDYLAGGDALEGEIPSEHAEALTRRLADISRGQIDLMRK